MRGLEVVPEKRDPRGNFRFFENRQKYLLFVHTCSEKRVSVSTGILAGGTFCTRICSALYAVNWPIEW